MQSSSSPGQRSDTDIMTQKATELIALLDRYLFLRGDTLLGFPSLTTTLADTGRELDPDVPVALQVYPVVPLTDHLGSLDQEGAEMSRVRNRLRVLMPDAAVVMAAKTIVGREYAELKEPEEEVAILMQKEIPTMLLQLRREQALETTPKIETFSFRLVLALHEDGRVSEVKTHHLDTKTSWADMQSTLTHLSATEFARARGGASGYSLQDGHWMYDLLNAKYAKEDKSQRLATWDDYRCMRRQMESGKWACVLIMHELVWEEAKAKKSGLGTKEEVESEFECPGAEEGWRWAVSEDFAGNILF